MKICSFSRSDVNFSQEKTILPQFKTNWEWPLLRNVNVTYKGGRQRETLSNILKCYYNVHLEKEDKETQVEVIDVTQSGSGKARYEPRQSGSR